MLVSRLVSDSELIHELIQNQMIFAWVVRWFESLRLECAWILSWFESIPRKAYWVLSWIGSIPENSTWIERWIKSFVLVKMALICNWTQWSQINVKSSNLQQCYIELRPKLFQISEIHCESWIDSNHIFGSPLESWVDSIQIFSKGFESWFDLIHDFGDLSWFDSNQCESSTRLLPTLWSLDVPVLCNQPK